MDEEGAVVVGPGDDVVVAGADVGAHVDVEHAAVVGADGVTVETVVVVGGDVVVGVPDVVEGEVGTVVVGTVPHDT